MGGSACRNGVPARGQDRHRHLWRDFKTSGDRAARERLILHYSPLVKYVAGRVAAGLPSSVEQSGLVSYGVFGLIDAIEKVDPARPTRFESYAMTRIRGAILDGLRATDWIPRSLRRKARDVQNAYAALQSTLHRTPTESEVAAELRITEAQLQVIFIQLSFVNVVALDELLTPDGEGGGLSLRETLEAVPLQLEARSARHAVLAGAAATAPLRAVARLIRASRSTW